MANHWSAGLRQPRGRPIQATRSGLWCMVQAGSRSHAARPQETLHPMVPQFGGQLDRTAPVLVHPASSVTTSTRAVCTTAAVVFPAFFRGPWGFVTARTTDLQK